jgi:hypothetical protein
MGAIARALANSITTGGVVQASAINNTSVSSVTALPSGVDTGDLVLISSQTASSSASIEFTSGLDSTYDSYVFKFINCHPQNDGRYLKFQFSTDGGSTYTVNMTTTFFNAIHSEDDTSYALLQYETGLDVAQSYPADLIGSVGNDNDENLCGTFQLFNPSSTTFVKHFISRISSSHDFPMANDNFVAGYANTTSAINGIKFNFHTGNIDAGTISLYGVKKS